MAARITFILGCTGCGKSGLGLELARRTGGEIISVDSMKVYRGMDVGTAKPSPEVRAVVPHHVIDVVDPWEAFSVARYVALAEEAIAGVAARGRPIFAVGGTALYIKALSEGLFEGPSADPALRARLLAEAHHGGTAPLHERLALVDPVAAGRIHANDLRRIVRALEVHELTGTPISALQRQWDREQTRHECTFIGLRRSPEDQSQRTNARVTRMIDDGLVREVRELLRLPRGLSTAARQALGYAEIISHLEGRMTLAEAVESIKINTRHFAKAQRTWFRRFRATEWIDAEPGSSMSEQAARLVMEYPDRWSPSPR
jgi:tRNA dimethylallyltransferase